MASTGEAHLVANVVPTGTKAEDDVAPVPLPVPFRDLELAGTIASVVIFLSNCPSFLTLAGGFGTALGFLAFSL